MGDYYADQVCDDGNAPGGKYEFACVPTIADAMLTANAGGAVEVVAGVGISSNDSSWGAAVSAASAADVVVLALGTDQTLAHEGRDLADIGLPGNQSALGLAVRAAAAAAGRPVVLLLVSSFPTAFDALAEGPAAVVLAYTPAFGAPALAALLFGDANRWGRAPMTVYPRAFQDAVSLFDFGMTPGGNNPGRSYRYYSGAAGAPLVSFGAGKSYSTFALACGGSLAPGAAAARVACNVTNLAGPDGDEVLMLFHRPSAATVARVAGAHPLPLSALVDFARVAVAAGRSATVTFELGVADTLSFTNEDGARALYPGMHFVDVFDGSANVTIALVLETPGDAVVVVRRPPRPPPAGV
jgi:hypothetical protein